jgi:hypothetical protein
MRSGNPISFGRRTIGVLRSCPPNKPTSCAWLCFLFGLTATTTFAQEQSNSDLAALLARVDRVRIPAKAFTAMLETTRLSKPGAKANTSRYRVFTRFAMRADRLQFDTLLACQEPPKDAGKLLLFAGDTCWLRDPRAKRPTRISPQQLWSQPVVTDSPNWRFSKDFDARLAGEDSIACGDGRERSCRVIELTPRPDLKSAPATLRYWVDREGYPWKGMHLSASGKTFRTVEYLAYESTAGGERPTAMRVTAGTEIDEIKFSQIRTQESPARFFDVDALPSLNPE